MGANHISRILGVSVIATAAAFISSAPPASAQPCPDVEIVFARGTGEPPGVGGVGQSFVDSLRSQLGAESVAVYPVNYDASDDLVPSANAGAVDANAHVESMAASCPNTKLVLGGYSQGASVVDIVTGTQIGGVGWGDSLPPQYASHVIAVTTFGNPAGLESARATKWVRHSLEGLDSVDEGEFMSVHGGFSTVWANADPNRILPLDIARKMEQEGAIGRLHGEVLATTGNGTTVADARRFGMEWAADLRQQNIQAVILTAT